MSHHGSSNCLCLARATRRGRRGGGRAGRSHALSEFIGGGGWVLPRMVTAFARSPLLRCDGELITLRANVPAPLPKEPAEEIWVRAAKTWPEASAVLLEHQAHLIVATVDKVQPPLRQARLVTAVVGGALDIVPGCSAVMWACRVVRQAALWKDQSRATPRHLHPQFPHLDPAVDRHRADQVLFRYRRRDNRAFILHRSGN